MHVNDAGKGSLSENVCIEKQDNVVRNPEERNEANGTGKKLVKLSKDHLYAELEFIFVFL